MNIFFLDEDATKAAQFQCDKHVVKMILESAQLMSTCYRLHPNQDTNFDLLYKATHVNHPCNKWVRQSLQNYNWLLRHALALCNEYTYRYGKIHKTQEKIEYMSRSIPVISSLGFTEPPQAMPDDCKIPGNPVEAYRKYYKDVKLKTIKCVWTKREKPKWIL